MAARMYTGKYSYERQKFPRTMSLLNQQGERRDSHALPAACTQVRRASRGPVHQVTERAKESKMKLETRLTNLEFE